MSGTWEPDWEALTRVSRIKHKITVQLVINEYLRQQAAQGIVAVRRDTLQRIYTRDLPPDAAWLIGEILAGEHDLAATEEP